MVEWTIKILQKKAHKRWDYDERILWQYEYYSNKNYRASSGLKSKTEYVFYGMILSNLVLFNNLKILLW